jgi:hypothetical protein
LPVVLAALLALLAGLLTAAPAGAQATPPAGQIGIRLLEAPTDRRDDPRAQVYVVDHLQPGDVIERRIEVSSTTDEPVEVALYPAAATVEAGEFRFGEGRSENELSRWTSVTPDSTAVPPGGAVEAVVRVAVPADAGDGERYGVVWAEVASGGEGGVQAVSRVGVRMYVSVGEGEEPPSDFVVDELTAVRDGEGRPVARARVTNTGGRALDMSGTLQLTGGPGGLSAGPFDATLGTTLGIGETAPVEVVLDPALPDGPWEAALVLRSGEVERRVQGRVTFTAVERTVPLTETGEDEQLLWPAVVAGALLLGALGLLLLLLKRRRERERQ